MVAFKQWLRDGLNGIEDERIIKIGPKSFLEAFTNFNSGYNGWGTWSFK